MENIKNKAESFIKENWKFLAFTLIFFIINVLTPLSNDDTSRMESFRTIENNSLWLQLKSSVKFAHHISPRYITYILTYGILYFKSANIICAVINSVALFAIIKGISNINFNGGGYWLSIFLVCFYPYTEMNSAGIVSTTMGYWLILAALISCMSFLKTIYTEGFEALSLSKKILFFISIFICANQEQAVILTTIILCVFIFMTVLKKRKGIIIGAVSLIIQFIGIANLFFGQGNRSRMIGELHWFRDFGTVSFVEKIQLSFIVSLTHIIFEKYGLFVILSLVTAFIIWNRYKDITHRLSAVIPLLIWGVALSSQQEIKDLVIPLTGKYGAVSIETYTSLHTYIPIANLCLIGGFTILNLCIISRTPEELIRLVGTLVLGVSTRIMMGFSPTVWASSSRTYIFMWFSIVLLIADIIGTYKTDIQNIGKNLNKNTKQLILFLVGFTAFIAFINNYFCLTIPFIKNII